jgi:hypothetical protein
MKARTRAGAMFRLALMLAGFCMWPVIGTAQEKKPSAIIGVGKTTCETWTTARDSKDASFVLQSWIAGFLTATVISYAGELKYDPLEKADLEVFWKWLDDYCRLHPDEKLGVAAAHLSLALTIPAMPPPNKEK